MEKRDSEKICVAVKQLSEVESISEKKCVEFILSNQKYDAIIPDMNQTEPLQFEKVFSSRDSNYLVFKEFMLPSVDNALNGICSFICCYGENSSNRESIFFGDSGVLSHIV